MYFQCWLFSISEGEGLCIYDLNFECFRWTSLQALILLDIWKTTSLPFLSLPRLSRYLLCWLVYFQCWLLSIFEEEGLCIYDLNFECFRWTSLLSFSIWKTTSLPFLSLPHLSQLLLCCFVYFQLGVWSIKTVCVFTIINFEWRTPQAPIRLFHLDMGDHQFSIFIP